MDVFRNLLVAGLAVGVLLGGAGLGSGHTDVVATAPVGGAKLAMPPGEVVVTFASPPARTENATVNVAGEMLSESSRLDPADATRLIIPLGPGPAGRYVAEWSVIAGDGHRIAGRSTFTASRPSVMLAALDDLGARLVRVGRQVRARAATAAASGAR